MTGGENSFYTKDRSFISASVIKCRGAIKGQVQVWKFFSFFFFCTNTTVLNNHTFSEADVILLLMPFPFSSSLESRLYGYQILAGLEHNVMLKG